MSNLRDRVNAAIMSCDGLFSLTSKLDIGTSSIYIKTAWMENRVVHLDITLSRGGAFHDDVISGDVDFAALEATNYDLARSWVEDSCRMASSLLESGSDIGSITSGWKGVKGFPHGLCPQLRMIVPGPLHAAAVLIDLRLESWRKSWIRRNG